MIPSQRDMVDRLQGQPFTLLGINTDGMSRSALQQELQQQKITWPQIADGSGGPLAKLWNVHAFPTVYIIDHRGIIRAKKIHGEKEIEKKVAKLLKKAPKKRA